MINLGDLNKDKKDEIALVVDVPDYSQLNTCHIYSLCNNQWTEIKRFSIHEGAFTFGKGEDAHNFEEIRGFLEKEKVLGNIWITIIICMTLLVSFKIRIKY